MADKPIQPSGIANKSNISDWSARAKSNSYACDKAELRHKLGTEGAEADLKINEAEAPPLKPYFEGRGWTKASADNTYTGKDGSKRD